MTACTYIRGLGRQCDGIMRTQIVHSLTRLSYNIGNVHGSFLNRFSFYVRFLTRLFLFNSILVGILCYFLFVAISVKLPYHNSRGTIFDTSSCSSLRKKTMQSYTPDDVKGDRQRWISAKSISTDMRTTFVFGKNLISCLNLL